MKLTGELRENFGKKVKELRSRGLIPAEIYGRGMENLHLSIPRGEFSKVYAAAGGNTVISLQIAAQDYPVVIHDVQNDFLTGEAIHVDFHKIRLDEKITAKVPFEFTGEAPAVKEFGGVISKALSEIEVEALPSDLPHRITVDLSCLARLEQTIYVKDLKISDKVKVIIDPETAVATIAAPREEEVVAETPVDVSAVKVETEEKKEERAAAKAETGEKEK